MTPAFSASRHLRVPVIPLPLLIPLLLLALVPAPARAQQMSPVDSMEARTSAFLAVSQYQQDLQAAVGRGAHPARESRRRRPAVIAELDRLARRIPGDDWVQGHRVGLRVKQGLLQEALEVAFDCRGTPWWCAALTGFVHQRLGEIAAASTAFDFALGQMPVEERCTWEDLGLLLDGAAVSAYRSLPCAERIEIARQVWWASNPLFLEEGNERRSEHMARFVALRLHEQSLGLAGLRCTAPHRRSLLRQGWPEHGWSWEHPFVPVRGAEGQAFMPGEEGVFDPIIGGARPPSAKGNDPFEPGEFGERMRARLGPVRELLDQQIAHFRRGDSVFVVAVLDRANGLAASSEYQVGLVVTAGPDGPEVTARPDAGPVPGPNASNRIMRVAVPDGRYLASLEVVPGGAGSGTVAPGRGRGGGAGALRARHAVVWPGGGGTRPTVSSPLLFEWGDELEERLEAVIPRALGAPRVPAGGEVGVYWEIYGLSRGQPVSVSLSAHPGEAGLLRRLGRLLRLVDGAETLEFRWTEAPEEPGVMGRILRLDLSTLPSGPYTLELSVDFGDGAPLRVERQLEIR
jgi:hypothetical protein